MTDKGPIRIMEFVTNNGVGEFIIRHEVIDNILLHDEVRNRKIVIMSIIGEYRKGKSFFLGYCLKFLYANYASTSNLIKPSDESAKNWLGDGNETLKGFSWRHGFDADTKGVLFWPDVFLCDSNSDKFAIILMDTQGLFEIGSTQEENARIFGLSILSSSIQIINLKDVIQENQIEYLDMATSFTKCINQKLSKGKKCEWKAFQRLLFLIRDWPYEDIDGGFGYGGGETYLNKFLNNDNNPKSESIRDNIRGSFDSIKCFLLNHPGSAVSKKDFNGEWSRLDEDFVANLKSLIESLLKAENLNTKSILGKEVTGEEFRDFMSTYLQAFRDVKIPDIGNIFQLTIENQMKAIVAEQLHLYQETMNEQLDFSQDDFESFIDNKHKDAKALAILNFLESDKMEDAESILKFQEILKSEIDKSFTTWRKNTLRDYQQYVTFRRDLQKLKQEKEEEKQKLIEKLQEFAEIETQNKAKYQQEFEKIKKEQQEQMDRFSEQIQSLNLTNNQKEEEMRKIKTEADEKQIKLEEKLKEQEEQNTKIQKAHEKLEKALEDQKEREEKIIRQHEKLLEKLEMERDKDKIETEKIINQLKEKMRNESEEQRWETDKKLRRLEKEYDTREEDRRRQEVRYVEEKNSTKASNPNDSLFNFLTTATPIMAKGVAGVYKMTKKQ